MHIRNTDANPDIYIRTQLTGLNLFALLLHIILDTRGLKHRKHIYTGHATEDQFSEYIRLRDKN